MQMDRHQVSVARRIDQQELEAFRASLPEIYQHETYRFLVWRWDIVRARYMLHKYPRATGNLVVADAARAYDLMKPIGQPEVLSDGTIRLHDSLMGIDAAFAMSDRIDLQQPVILGLIELPGRAAPTPLLLDGLHRLYRAAQDALVHLPCLVLAPDEERLCRLS